MGYLKEAITEVRPILELIYNLMDELEQKDKELAEIRDYARHNGDSLNKALNQVNELKKSNHALQLFIEEHVDEEKKKLIFKDTSDSQN